MDRSCRTEARQHDCVSDRVVLCHADRASEVADEAPPHPIENEFEGMISRKNRQLVWFLIRVAAETSPSIKADSFKITVRIYDPVNPRGKLRRISIPILANRAYTPSGL